MFDDMAWDISREMIDPFPTELQIAPYCPSNSIPQYRSDLTSRDMTPRLRVWN
jgi:hypothetical protein